MKKLFPEIPVLNNGQIELRALTQADAEALEEMVNSRRVYRYLPTFLFEKKYPDLLRREKGIEIITASSMIENHASARILEKTASPWWYTRRKKTGDLTRRLWPTSGSCSAGPGTKMERIYKYDHKLFRRDLADEIY